MDALTFQKGTSLYLGIVLLITITGCGTDYNSQKSDLKRAWEYSDRPDQLAFDQPLIYNYKKLPASGTVAKEPWSASYWPDKTKGIAYRWQYSDSATYLNQSTVLSMSPSEIARLSPAEKFDILRNQYHFPLTSSERRKGGWFTPWWHGLCHGWVSAAIFEPLPGHSVTLTNNAGVKVKFYQDDIKALLTRAWADLSIQEVWITSRKNFTGNNAGTLHVLLANWLGIRKKTFGIDRDYGNQVWNQPVYSYQSEYGEITLLDKNTSFQGYYRAPGTIYLLDVKTVITYVDEHEWGDVNPRDNLFRHMYLYYSLELDADYRIIGGEYYPEYWVEGKNYQTNELYKYWDTQQWPDWVFLKTQYPSDTGIIPYSKVKEILNASLRNNDNKINFTSTLRYY